MELGPYCFMLNRHKLDNGVELRFRLGEHQESWRGCCQESGEKLLESIFQIPHDHQTLQVTINKA